MGQDARERGILEHNRGGTGGSTEVNRAGGTDKARCGGLECTLLDSGSDSAEVVGWNVGGLCRRCFRFTQVVRLGLEIQDCGTQSRGSHGWGLC